MIIDTLANADKYAGLGERFQAAFKWLRESGLAGLEKGKHSIEGDRIFAIVNEYDTIPAEGEQMESHRKHIDVQYIVSGEELVGHDMLRGQQVSRPYDDNDDFMLWADRPSFYTRLTPGDFAIFWPTDLHMPNLISGKSVKVRKIVIKIATGK
ncbi:YhcH/YjgK/YiaL family protein [Chitinophaga sp.]|uniref:YhcH/YjgK/YiaL family protein n=1 Tax=Chitinophaga sp. TaxID=1869181 RepID=UPI00262338E0|nr:YhcH/YjgK/YiaL family protein [uncultured Chitinophaga sp.]